MALGSDHRSLCRLRRFSWYNGNPLSEKAELLTAFRTVTLTLLVPTKRFAFPQRFTRITVFVWRTSTRAITCH